MTLGDVLQRVQRDRPGEVTEDEMCAWITQLDVRFYQEQVLRHEGGDQVAQPAYTAQTSRETQLLIPCPWDEVYIHHLYACVDYRLGEIDRYNNSAALFTEAWSDACRAWRRTHMPLGARIHHVVRGERWHKAGDGECILS